MLFVFVTTWFNSANASFVCVAADGHTCVENIYSSPCHQAEFETNDVSDHLTFEHNCEDTSLLGDSINSSFNYFEDIKLKSFPVKTFIQAKLVSINKVDQYYLPILFIDNSPRLFTDSLRLII